MESFLTPYGLSNSGQEKLQFTPFRGGPKPVCSDGLRAGTIESHNFFVLGTRTAQRADLGTACNFALSLDSSAPCVGLAHPTEANLPRACRLQARRSKPRQRETATIRTKTRIVVKTTTTGFPAENSNEAFRLSPCLINIQIRAWHHMLNYSQL